MRHPLDEKGFSAFDSLNLWLIAVCLIWIAMGVTCNERAAECRCECERAS